MRLTRQELERGQKAGIHRTDTEIKGFKPMFCDCGYRQRERAIANVTIPPQSIVVRPNDEYANKVTDNFRTNKMFINKICDLNGKELNNCTCYPLYPVLRTLTYKPNMLYTEPHLDTNSNRLISRGLHYSDNYDVAKAYFDHVAVYFSNSW